MKARPILQAVALALVAACAMAAKPAGVATIPALHGAVLTGAAVDLPQALEGHTGVLVVGFSQNSRDAVAGWGRRLANEYGGSQNISYYEMPVLAAVPKLLRGYVLRKVTGDVPDRARAHCLPVLDHEAEWKAAAGFTRDDDAYVLIVEGSGKVTARIAGPADDEHFAELKRRLIR